MAHRANDTRVDPNGFRQPSLEQRRGDSTCVLRALLHSAAEGVFKASAISALRPFG